MTKTTLLQHLRSHLGHAGGAVASLGHVDIFSWPDPEDATVVVLATAGMSERSMNVPSGSSCASREPRVELVMDVSKSASEAAARLLLDLSEFPFVRQEFLHWGHVVPLGRPFVENSALTHLYLSFPDTARVGAETVWVEPNHTRIDLLWVIPISDRERAVFDASGAGALEALLEEGGVVVSDPFRRSVA